MMNLIRADFYRIRQSWVIYVTFAVALIASIGLIVLWTLLGPGTGDYPVNLNGVDITVPTSTVNGADSIGFLLQLPHFLLTILVLPLVFCVAVPIFTDKTAKNDIAFGMSRTKLYVSKLIQMAILITLLFLLYVGAGTLLATILGGFGSVTAGFWSSLFQALGTQLFLLIALGCLGIFLGLAIKKPAVLTELYFVLILLPVIIAVTASLLNVDISWLLRFDLMSSIHRAGSLILIDTHNILIILGVGAVWMIASSAAGIAMFRKAEIK